MPRSQSAQETMFGQNHIPSYANASATVPHAQPCSRQQSGKSNDRPSNRRALVDCMFGRSSTKCAPADHQRRNYRRRKTPTTPREHRRGSAPQGPNRRLQRRVGTRKPKTNYPRATHGSWKAPPPDPWVTIRPMVPRPSCDPQVACEPQLRRRQATGHTARDYVTNPTRSVE